MRASSVTGPLLQIPREPLLPPGSCFCPQSARGRCLMGSDEDRSTNLILQLSLRTGFALMPLPVTVLGHGLMDAPPQRPAEEMIEHYTGDTLQAANELADLAHAEGDQRSRLRRPLLCDVTALSFTRRAARKPKASMASVMCRYQPCQERIS